MKLTRAGYLWLLLGLYAFLPVTLALAMPIGYRVRMPYAYVNVLLIVGATALAGFSASGDSSLPISGPLSVWIAFLPLLVECSWFVYCLSNASLLLPLLMTPCLIYALWLAQKLTACRPLRIVTLSLAYLLLIPLVPFTLFFAVFGSIGSSGVAERVYAPGSMHYAEVVENDEGALGGHTNVEAHWSPSLDLFLIRYESVPEVVYTGPWGMADTLTVTWTDADTLLVTGEEIYREARHP